MCCVCLCLHRAYVCARVFAGLCVCLSVFCLSFVGLSVGRSVGRSVCLLTVCLPATVPVGMNMGGSAGDGGVASGGGGGDGGEVPFSTGNKDADADIGIVVRERIKRREEV